MTLQSFVVLTWMRDTSELVLACDTMEEHRVQHSNGVVWCGPLHLAFPGDVADACTNIQQVASKEEEEEEEEGTPHIDTWRNARVWVDFFGGLH
jgi:hypothetical protein